MSGCVALAAMSSRESAARSADFARRMEMGWLCLPIYLMVVLLGEVDEIWVEV